MLSYAGEPLPLVTGELKGWLDSYLSTADLRISEQRQATIGSLPCLQGMDQPAMRLSRLSWPTGLSRYASALFCCTYSQLDRILRVVDTPGAQQRQPADLRIGKDITVKMHLLTPVQVAGKPLTGDGLLPVDVETDPAGNYKDPGQLWLLPLVDERFFLLAGCLHDMKSSLTWEDWFKSVHESTSINCTVDTIDAKFGYPGGLFYDLPKDSPGLPVLADNAAYCIGRRYVRQLSGDYALQTYDKALPLVTPVTGFGVIAGSRNNPAPIVLPKGGAFSIYGSDTAIDVVADTLDTWPGHTRWHGGRNFHLRCKVSDTAKAEDYAKAFLKETLRWRFIHQDVTFADAKPFTLTGGEDRLEITVNADSVTTRVYARHSEWHDTLSVRFTETYNAEDCEGCGGGGGGTVAGPENCPRVSHVGCTAGIMTVGYQLACESIPDPVQGPPAGGPVGTIVMWGTSTIPNGWLECDGKEFDPTVFPELFDVLGDRYVPDLRNQFVRGKGDKTGALLSKKAWTTGMPKTPFKASAAGGHDHSGGVMPGSMTGNTSPGGFMQGRTGREADHVHTITGGDTETAPDHVILLYIIKAEI